MVRGAVKLQEASASQVRCTCSMQGLNAHKTPSGRRHASADFATCAGHPGGICNPKSCLMIALKFCPPKLSAPPLLRHSLCKVRSCMPFSQVCKKGQMVAKHFRCWGVSGECRLQVQHVPSRGLAGPETGHLPCHAAPLGTPAPLCCGAAQSPASPGHACMQS